MRSWRRWKRHVGGGEKLAAAVEDFFVAWLVEGKAAIAMSYVEERACACVLEFEPGSSTTETAPYRIMKDMREARLAVGPVQNLDDAVESVRPEGLSMESVPNPDRDDAYALLSYADGHAEQLDCRLRREGRYSERSGEHGRHFAAAFQLKGAGDHSAVITLLWAKEGGSWKIIAFDLSIA